MELVSARTKYVTVKKFSPPVAPPPNGFCMKRANIISRVVDIPTAGAKRIDQSPPQKKNVRPLL